MLKNTLDSLNQDIDSQRQEAERLQISLLDTQNTLKRAIIQYRNELDEQKSLIESQGVQIDKLARARIRMDFLLDSGYFLFIRLAVLCAFIVSKSFYGSIVNQSVRVVPNKYRLFAKRVLQFISFLGMFSRARGILNMVGIHGKLESIN